MSSLFALLFLAALITLVIGLFRPSLLSRFFKGVEPTRKKVGLVFGTSTVVFMLLTGITGGKAASDTTTQQATASTPTPSATATTASATPTPTATTPTPAPTATPTQAPTPTPTPQVSAEYKSALSQGTSYANTMHMSKQGVYDQLVSQYGGQFSAAAAQYAIDNVQADWNANALAKAKDYQDTMHLSPSAIHDQLTSANGEKFTKAEADYAIQHLND
jgi:hypothetical protein